MSDGSESKICSTRRWNAGPANARLFSKKPAPMTGHCAKTLKICLSHSTQRAILSKSRSWMIRSLHGQSWEFHSVEPDHFARFAISRNDRRIYYSLFSSEATIWLLSLK
jgi:hypothetical protein